MLNEYNVNKYTFIFDNYFYVEYLIDLFTNFTFYDVIILNKKSAEHYLLNKNKKKIVKEFSCSKESDIVSYVSNNIKSKCLMHGQNMILKNLTLGNNFIVYKKLGDEEILDIFVKEEMKEKHDDLKKCFDMTSNEKEVHLLVYGKLCNEIKVAIESYRLKKLFVHVKVLRKLQQMVPNECFNFELVVVDSIENNDIAQTLMDQYDGAIGIAYY